MYQLVNTMLINKNKNNPSTKIVFVRKDKDGNKTFQYVEDVKLKYYYNKPEYMDIGMVNFIEPEKVNGRICRYDDLYKDMASVMNGKLKNFYIEAVNSGEGVFSKLRRMHLDYGFHGTDKNIVDSYITAFYKKHNPDENLFGITKAFMDIEVDGSVIVGFPEPSLAEAPVNVITLVCDNGHVYTLCLKYDTETYENCMSQQEELINDLKERYKDAKWDFKFKIEEFDDELDLIKRFFYIVNEIERPDFMAAWNATFDYQYLYNRILKLDADPATVCCPEDLEYKGVHIKIDTKNSDPCDKSDLFEFNGYSVYVDQLAIYANLRKSAKEESYALDYIGGKLLGIHKDKVEGDIKTFHFIDYRKFLFYNIQDAIMLLQIEEKNKDFDLFQKIASLTETRVTHALKKTVCLRNLADKFYRDKGLIISNNRSKLYVKDESSKIRGALN